MKITFDQLTEPMRVRLYDLIDAINYDCLSLVKYYGNGAVAVRWELVYYWNGKPRYTMASDYLPELLDWPWAAEFILEGVAR